MAVLKTPKELVINICLLFAFSSLQLSDANEFCEEPPHIENGEPILGNLTPPFTVGTNIKYSCHDGYTLTSNGTDYARCLHNFATAYWQPANVACESVCNKLPFIPNGGLLLGARHLPFMPGETIRYLCDPGYIPDLSNPYITCFSYENGVANWTQTDNLCKVSEISCNDPGYIENAHRIGYVFTYPHNITYVCEEGYKLIGTATRYCSPKGQWLPSSPPLCQLIVCPALSHPQNGKVISSQRKLHSIATYECDRYYNLSGNFERVCQEDGTWSGVRPTCKEITCLDPGAVLYVRVIPEKKLFHKAGDLVIFKCKYGTHQTSSKCLETGEWSKRPPLCPGPETTENPPLSTTVIPKIITHDPAIERKVSCDDPGKIKNGERAFLGLSINSTVTYTCEHGYELRGKGTLLCMENGKWDLDKLPICVKPLSVLSILAIVVGILLLLAVLGGGAYFLYKWREKKVSGYGKKSKALTADATDLEEIAGLEKGKKPIPVTVL